MKFTSKLMHRAGAVSIGLAALALFTTTLRAANIAVPTQHYDNARSGANTQETDLTIADVKAGKFGKLFALQLDDPVNGQVLYVPKCNIDGAVHNTIFAYTGKGNGDSSSLYAFDADNYNAGQPLWRLQFPAGAEWTTCAPAINTTSGIIYVLTKETTDSGPTQLHAIDMYTGIEKLNSPVTISGTVPGTADGGSEVTFDTTQENSRPGLLIIGKNVYCGFSHANDGLPFNGWVFGYNYSKGKWTQTGVFCTTPDGSEGGVWQSGDGLMADSNGYIYCASGNGTFDANTGGDDYGMCYLKLSTPNLQVVDWFSPHDEAINSNNDHDLGGAGPIGLPGTAAIFAGGTKFGSAFLLDSDDLGGFSTTNHDNVLNRINGVSAVGVTAQNPVCWSQGPVTSVYLWPRGSNLQQFRYLVANGKILPNGPFKQHADTSGASLTVSADATKNGILWALTNTDALRAFPANDVSVGELWDSNIDAARDGVTEIGHWQFMTEVNGHLYVPTGDSQILVYGLLPLGAEIRVEHPVGRRAQVASARVEDGSR